ncbi:hypothetical protein HPP92_011285 [Vanilla planifolia]|uniref:Uncharacterized protein n=1 Tax=Vanilla planifolia TaxID=51239 RepID=A0A835V017_VANPL|nr:hypothetical protein HPP92_011285 [Vanilla planifolia]
MAVSFFDVAIAVAAVVVAATIWLRLRVKLPPGPRPWPVVGNLYDIQPVRFRCFADWAARYGPIMSVWFGTTLNVVVSSSELAREVLKEKDQMLADRPRSRSAARFSRDGKDLIWADYGPHYVKVRKVCNLELFSPKRLEAPFAPSARTRSLPWWNLSSARSLELKTHIDALLISDKNGDHLVVRNHLSGVAFNNITRLAFGKRFVSSEGVLDSHGSEFKAIVANGLKFGASLSLAEYVSWLQWMFPLDEEAYAKHGARRDRLTRAIMEEHSQARKKSGARQHFVDALITLQEKYDLGHDHSRYGYDCDLGRMGHGRAGEEPWSSGEGTGGTRPCRRQGPCHDRSRFPESPIPAMRRQGVPSAAPPTPLMLPHKASTKVKIGGYDIPKGSNVHVNVWAIARDPAMWKDPLKFAPERFEEEDIDIRGHDFRVLPFGAGRRVCPGAQLGINLVQSMLGHLLHHFRWRLPEGVSAGEVDMMENPGMVAFMHTPLQAVATPRLPEHLYKRLPVDM